MPNIHDSFPSSLLKAADFDENGTEMTIVDVRWEALSRDETEERPVLYFEEDERGFGLNKTNAGSISSMYGPMTEDWIGKKVTLYQTETDYQGSRVPCVRVKKKPVRSSRPVGSGKVASKPKPPQDDEEEDTPF